MPCLYLSNGTQVTTGPLDANNRRYVQVTPDDREMTDAEWSEYCHIINAIHLLRQYTNSRFDIGNLAGPRNAARRVSIMQELTGRPVPQRAAGINALTAAFHKVGRISGSCIADRNAEFLLWVRAY